MDKYDLYELCVQSPTELIPLLVAAHGGDPRVLGEDFSGTALLSRMWSASSPLRSAIAVDHDAAVLARARGAPRVTCVTGDVRDATRPDAHGADVIFAGNFSIGEIAERPELLRYLRHCRARLHADGVFVCDTYGGSTSLRPGALERARFAPDGARVRFTWEQRAADPLTARVVDALHFRVERAGEVVLDLPDAFVYRWRLWTVPELSDALLEAGFRDVEVWKDLCGPDDGPPRSVQLDEPPVRRGKSTDDGFAVCVSGRH
ncbi:MAG: class I SAM-dependent methyltransferase [Planctomycetota bacterium]